MAYHFCDNVYTKTFTPREYQVELLEAAKERNIIVCLGNGPNKVFIALKLIQELANAIRRPYRNGGKRTLFIANSAASVAQNAITISHLTDLKVGQYFDERQSVDLDHHQVLVMTCEVCWVFLSNRSMSFQNFNLVIIDDCHQAIRDHPLRQVVEIYSGTRHPKPRILGLTAPLVPGPGGAEPGRLEAEIKQLENTLNCTAETASDIVSVLRYCAKPRELVLQCGDYGGSELSEILEEQLAITQEFLDDHRYDPTEIYDDEFLDDLKNIPDPKVDPYNILSDFHEVLKTMGPWCADRAALVLLIHIEKLKVKTPYERHFLLLCLVSSVMLKIRAICDHTFQFIDEKERIYKYSSPKILRLIEIIRQFKPKTSPTEESQPCIEESKNKSNSSIQINSGAIETVDIIIENGNSSNSDSSNSSKVITEKCNDNTTEKYDQTKSNLSQLKTDTHKVKRDVYNNCMDCMDCGSTRWNACMNEDSIDDVNCKKENCDVITDPDESVESECTCKVNNESLSSNFIENEVYSGSSDLKKMNKLNDIKSVIRIDNTLNITINCHNGTMGEDNDKHSEPNNLLVKVNNFILTKDNDDHVTLLENIVNKNSNSHNRTCHVNNEESKEMVVRSNMIEDMNERSGRWRGRGKSWRFQRRNQNQHFSSRTNKSNYQDDADSLCGIIFVESRFTAKILFHLLNELRKADSDFSFVCPQYTVGKIADPVTEPREAEIEHRKQEDVLKRFRMRECNVLVSTAVLEEGIDLPKCNLIVRYDTPTHYRSYAQSKGRARAQDSHFLLMVEDNRCNSFLEDLSQFMEIERMLLARCTSQEPPESEESDADLYTDCIEPYKPVSDGQTCVTMATAVALVNRYCAKLPSDTFTRLTPLWWINEVNNNGQLMYTCTLRLPINSPVKQNICGHLMPTRVLARRIAALEACRILHQAKELDDNLQPIGKEGFRALESSVDDEMDPEDQDLGNANWDSLEPRPGTTKRRQYYYKRIASSLSGCRPEPGKAAWLYELKMVLTCPLPEEQNTRGRKLHPPEEALQGFGILTLKDIPKICPFPIFTRCGEVQVSLELRGTDLVLSEWQLNTIAAFLNYTFTSVLRLQKYLMLFDPDASENSYLIVPTKKSDSSVDVDWDFLEMIHARKDDMPHLIPDEERKSFIFDPAKYRDAVVMPWYRNQDQPQYFYVAEICNHLNPKSSFPGSDYKTFEEYYLRKYGIQVQNTMQPLLDVDHTSARLNFLTPRYVNRKGVALPTSSEETKRAKRENLEQKQILVPELCMIHPFPASLWRQAVSLPCILYRINALLLADEIRTTVAKEIALGQLQLKSDEQEWRRKLRWPSLNLGCSAIESEKEEINESSNVHEEFEWPPLDFGWSLADVLRKSKEENEKLLANKAKTNESEVCTDIALVNNDEKTSENDSEPQPTEDADKTDESREEKDAPWMEIGTWSNEMAELGDDFDPYSKLPPNLTMVRYGSPTSWECGGVGSTGNELCLYDSDVESDISSEPPDDSSDQSDDSKVGAGRGLRITFKNDYLAEAVDDDFIENSSEDEVEWQWEQDAIIDLEKEVAKEVKRFQQAVKEHHWHIKASGMLLASDTPFVINQEESSKSKLTEMTEKRELNFKVSSYGMPSERLEKNCDSVISTCERENSYSSQFSSDEEEDNDLSLFSFDAQPDLKGHPGPSPSVLLQALTMSNANDGINLERLETIGDSFLKYAITTYLYCTYEAVHEGKLSHLRSKQVSNLNLYRLGKRKVFGESMIATKFEPHDNWLPPCYLVPKELECALIEAGLPACHWNQSDIPAMRDMTRDEISAMVKERGEQLAGNIQSLTTTCLEDLPCFVPYNLITQHSIPDKSIADCVEALIGAYLIACGPRGALLFMSWLGIRVLPYEEVTIDDPIDRPVGSLVKNGSNVQIRYGSLKPPKTPLLRHVANPEGELERLLDGFDVFECRLKYRFNDRSYLLQAMTHASFFPNRLTDCYQRLEFLGDAVLDYLITRHLYEDKRQHSPGALTDLRSALVNNTIFASLAVRHGFHKFFRHLSPGLAEVVERFVRIQEDNAHAISEEYYLISEEECEEAEDVEVPKALGDVFESVAGAVFLDSRMSLDAVWKVYYRMMKTEIEQFSTNVPKSPIRELLELEPETAKFGKPEKLADGRRVRVTVEVFGKGAFKGIGRNYRIAKCTAAKCALKQLKKRGLLARKLTSQHW